MANNPSREIKTANPLDNLFRSNALQKGKKRVANIPPINSGIKKSFAKYNPAKMRKTKTIFFIIKDKDSVMLYRFLACIYIKNRQVLNLVLYCIISPNND